MCSNQYHREKQLLIEDKRQFEKLMKTIQQKQKLYVIQDRYRMEMRKMMWGHRSRERELQIQSLIAKLESKVLLRKKEVFTTIQRLSSKQQYATKKEQNKVNIKPFFKVFLNLQYKLQKQKLQAGWKFILDESKRKDRLQIKLSRIQRIMNRKFMNNGFSKINLSKYDGIVFQQRNRILILENQAQKLREQNTKNQFKFKQNVCSEKELKNKDSIILQLRNQLQRSKTQYEQQIEQLQDQLNRLNMENIKLKPAYDNLINKTITINESVDDLSLRILDDIDIIPGKNIQQELSEKYFHKIVGLKETIENTRQLLQNYTADKNSLSNQQIQQLFKALQYNN